ncbi:putative formamidase [Fulvia fulva]|nr:putative formamidase [Fulvia fulva]
MPKYSFHVNRKQYHLNWDNRQPPQLTVNSGDVVTFDCIDGSNYQINLNSTAKDVANLDTSIADPVFGPVYINRAEPGNALEIEVLELEHADWGWTAIVPGFGLLGDEFPEAHLKIWNLPTSTTLTNGESKLNGHSHQRLAPFNDKIHIPIHPFMGTMGVAPSQPGAFSTIPPLDTGGNIDCRHITRGTKLILPVRTPGALFSCGDGHAAQGDGEVCGSAIETPMRVTVRFKVVKSQPHVQSPHFWSPPRRLEDEVLPDKGSYSTMGIDEDILEATRKAVRAMIEWLGVTKGLERVEAYMLCSVAVDLKMSEIVDMPNFAIVATVPLNIFVDGES